MPNRARRPFWPLYAVWIFFCAMLFLALRHAEDPSRRSGRILSSDAGRMAMDVLRAGDAARFNDFHVVHVAWARAGEAAPQARWIVLADRLPHSGLEEAVVVELAAEDGRLLRIRRPL